MSTSGGLKFIALISGGKDSLFSIVHCMRNGHTCVALANLYPHDVKFDKDGSEIENDVDTDSYMYQTVGHSIIPLYEEALGIPLYRRPISGTSVDQSLAYHPGDVHSGVQEPNQSFDEAEDVLLLLKDVLVKHPDAQAVSTGAILSTYQRARVESVTIRLGLVPLSYLWQYPYFPPYPPFNDEHLLTHMRDVRQKAIIIKVASGGLDDSVLGLNVADQKTINRLRSRMARFNPAIGALVGEGGEFETLTLEGPAPLWRKRITFQDSHVVVNDGGSFAIHMNGVKTEEISSSETQGNVNDLVLPTSLPSHPSSIQEICRSFVFDDWKTATTNEKGWFQSSDLYSDIGLHEQGPVSFTLTEQGSCIRMSNIMATGATAGDQMEQITEFVRGWLESCHQLKPSSIVSTTVLLKSMKDFQHVNTAYSKLFTEALPPARVTVAIGNFLPPARELTLSITAYNGPRHTREGLHVQSRSYWAPANIGPYSQAMAEPLTNVSCVTNTAWPTSAIVHLAGQIPLVPATMNLMDLSELDRYRTSIGVTDCNEAVALRRASILLALQNLLSVVQAMDLRNGCMTAGVAFFSERSADYAEEAQRAWTDIVAVDHENQEHSETVFPNMHGNPKTTQLEYLNDLERRIKVAEASRSWEKFTNPDYLPRGHNIAPCFSVFVSELPRNALVEWWSIGLKHSETRWDGWQDEYGNKFYPSVSVLTGVRVTWICIKHAQHISRISESAEFAWIEDGECNVDDMSKGPVITLFAAASIEKIWMKWRCPTLIPCEKIIHNGEGYDALILAIHYPSVSNLETLQADGSKSLAT